MLLLITQLITQSITTMAVDGTQLGQAGAVRKAFKFPEITYR